MGHRQGVHGRGRRPARYHPSDVLGPYRVVLERDPVLPPASRSHRYVMADGTYVPYGWCLLALTGDDGRPVAWQWCSTETKDAYRQLFGRSKRPGLLV